jgi:mannose-6-phosphate isomerase-like protein (cupin superfamily)
MIGCAKRMLESADGTRVDKPWGYELRWAITDRYVGKVLHINRGAALSLQYHERKDETVLVAEGEMDFELDDDQGRLVTRRMCPGDAVRVLPGRRHRMIAVEDCQVFEVSTPELDDVVRLADRYGRAGS